MNEYALTPNCSASVIARFLKARGIDRIFTLCGGHIMPLWVCADLEGIRIIDVRDERAAVHMAHAHAELTGGLAVAMVTAGPGVTNAITGIANAHVARAPVMILSGVPPRPQENRGALQDLVHTELVRSITRYARTVREPTLLLPELDEAVARAFGQGGEPGPVYLDFPTDTLRAEVPVAMQLEEYFSAKKLAPLIPDPTAIGEAAKLILAARKPLVISGRGARGAARELTAFLDWLGGAYLDTGESRSLVPKDHPSIVGALRGMVMGDVDLVITVGRRLDFQLAYGSPAVFGNAKFIRIADCAAELRGNRRGAVELFADPATALRMLMTALNSHHSGVDRDWMSTLRAKQKERAVAFARASANAKDDAQGHVHPSKLLHAVQERMQPDAVVIADGGDFLSFSRIGLNGGVYMDPGALGCLGVGVPFGIAASLAYPERQVVVATGDGSFGFNAMEIDTAVRHGAKMVIIVANNGAWQIEVFDQEQNYHRVFGTRLQFSDHAAMARAFGMHGERVERTEDLPAALDRAFANQPALVDVLVATDAISPDAKSGLAVIPDLQPLATWEKAEREWRAKK